MQKLAEVCIRRPVFATMIVLALVVVGAASYFRLGVDRFPSVELPTVSVRTELPGACSLPHRCTSVPLASSTASPVGCRRARLPAWGPTTSRPC